MFISSCAAIDPSVKDLKSPCVSSPLDFEGKSPCTKRHPEGNIPLLA